MYRHDSHTLGRLARRASIVAVAVLVAACGGGAQVQVGTPDKTAGTSSTDKPAVSATAEKTFNDALQQLAAHDRANDWTADSGTAVAKQFLDAAAAQKAEAKREFPEALYNAGLAYQRGGKDAEAKAQYQAALNINDKFHRARTQLTMYDYREKGDAAIDTTIGQLQQAVTDAQFQNVEALVNLASLQMKKGQGDDAKKNLQRALAIDDGYMPAFNVLAQYYLDLAKAKAGKKSSARASTFVKSKRADVQQLELAALVCSQAIRKNPSYAPIHNTAGLIQVELQNINSAVQEFQAATKADPSFFEAQMNYAAVNLSFRGFKAAEDAYRAALKMRPNDFDAHLGLALAIRGQIDDSNFDQYVAGAQTELDTCKKLAPERPETYYNEAILTQEYKAKGTGNDAVPVLEQAVGIYETFVAKAGTAPEFADAVKRAKDRKQDLADIIRFIKEGQTAAAIEAAQQQKDLEQQQQPDGTAPTEGAPADGAQPAPAPAPKP